MRVKKSIAVGIIILIAITAILVIAPFLSLEYNQRSDHKTLIPGESFFLYTFSDGAVYSYINSTPTILQQVGVLKLTYEGATVNESLVISGPSYNGTQSNFTYTQVFRLSETLKSSSPFVQVFINNFSRSRGTIQLLDGSDGVVSGFLSYPYYIPYNGNNQTISHYASSIGYTQPYVVALGNFNETGTSVNYPYGNYYCYDNNRAHNILVSMHLVAGTCGISLFLSQLLGYTNVNKPVLEVTNFNFHLIGTNTVLSPLNLYHYMYGYLPIELLLWVVGLLYIATTVKAARKRINI